MRIAAINPPFLPKFSRESRSPAVTKSGTLYYPMWLAYAVGNLEKHGHEVLFLDAPAQGMGLEEVKTKVISFAPHMAVFDTSTPSIYNDIKAAVEIKAALTDLFVVLDGRATLVTGGTVAGAHRIGPGEMRGSSVEGGARQELRAGDVAHVPAGLSHQMLVANGETVTCLVMKVQENL